jgi:uroporphyrinogen decarboxylase
MNSLERVAAVLDGRIPDKVPVALHNFLMAAKMAGQPMSSAFQDGKLLAEAQLAAWRRFKHDMLLVENGTTAMAQAFGCEVAYSADHPPYVVKPIVKDWSDIDKLKIPDPTKTFPLTCLLEATRILKAEIGGQVFLQMRSDQAPLAQASALRGYEQFFLDLADEANHVHIRRLAAICREATQRFSLALQDAGAHGTCIGEFGPAAISPRLYRSLALPELNEYFRVMRGAGFISALHQCGNTLAVIDDMAGVGANVLELDPDHRHGPGEGGGPGKNRHPWHGRSGGRVASRHPGTRRGEMQAGHRDCWRRRRIYPWAGLCLVRRDAPGKHRCPDGGPRPIRR